MLTKLASESNNLNKSMVFVLHQHTNNSSLTVSLTWRLAMVQAELSKPWMNLQSQLQGKIKNAFGRIEFAAASNAVITQACQDGKQQVEECIQYLWIADAKGYDVAMAFAKGPVVAMEGQRKRLAEERASIRCSFPGYNDKPYSRPTALGQTNSFQKVFNVWCNQETYHLFHLRPIWSYCKILSGKSAEPRCHKFASSPATNRR